MPQQVVNGIATHLLCCRWTAGAHECSRQVCTALRIRSAVEVPAPASLWGVFSFQSTTEQVTGSLCCVHHSPALHPAISAVRLTWRPRTSSSPKAQCSKFSHCKLVRSAAHVQRASSDPAATIFVPVTPEQGGAAAADDVMPQTGPASAANFGGIASCRCCSGKPPGQPHSTRTHEGGNHFAAHGEKAV
jgi:hypothetical protein